MRKAILSFLMLGMPLGLSAASSYYKWDNQQGLVEAKKCKIEELGETTIRVSGFTGNQEELIEKFRDRHHNHQTHLVVGSLIILKVEKIKKTILRYVF